MLCYGSYALLSVFRAFALSISVVLVSHVYIHMVHLPKRVWQAKGSAIIHIITKCMQNFLGVGLLGKVKLGYSSRFEEPLNFNMSPYCPPEVRIEPRCLYIKCQHRGIARSFKRGWGRSVCHTQVIHHIVMLSELSNPGFWRQDIERKILCWFFRFARFCHLNIVCYLFKE